MNAAPLAQAAPDLVRETHIELARWTAGAGLVIGVALTAAAAWVIIWLYRNERRGQMSRATRIGLTGIRCLILFLLGIVGLEPVLTPYLQRTIHAVTIVLIDDSASMSLNDHYRRAEDRARVTAFTRSDAPDGTLRRTNIAAALLERDNGAMLSGLARNNAVRVFRFSDGATALDGGRGGQRGEQSGVQSDADRGDPGNAAAANPTAPQGGGLADKLTAQGAATDLSRAIRDAQRAVAGAPIAGVVVLTDGGLNQGESVDATARALESADIPLFAVGVGDPATPVNVRVTEITGPRNAFSKDPFKITVQIAADGVEDDTLAVELLRRDRASSDPRVVDSKNATRNADGRFAPVEFEQQADEPGPVVFAARVQLLPFEAVEADNVRDISPPIQVLEDKMRVLIVSGAPTKEYRFVSRLLERDETVELSCWLQSADPRAVRDGNIVIDHLPVEIQEINEYDVVILLDPDPDGLSSEWATHVAALVDEFGGGLLYGADTKWTSFFVRDPDMRPIVTSLPVVFDPEAELTLNRMGRFQLRDWPILIPPEAVGSPIIRQASDVDLSLQIWSILEGVYWHYPVRREKPAASVLMRHGNPQMTGPTGPHVLLATQFIGAGRTAYLGFNSSWRWQRFGDEYLERFWVQTIRYLMEGKLLGGKQRGDIETERDEYHVGESVTITIRALDERFEPLLADAVDLTIQRDDAPAQRVSAAAIPGRDGFYQARFVADRVGPVRLTVALPSRTGEDATAHRELFVRPADLEYRDTAMNRALLQSLASRTGGRYFDVDQAGALPDAIRNRSEVLPPLRERPIPLWDNSTVFAIIITLLTIEWIGRKRARLL